MNGQPTYDTIGQSYTRSRRADPRIVDALFRLLGLPEGSLVADIGAGTGNYTRALAERGLRMVAVEPSPVMREQAASHGRVRWVEGTAEALPLPDSSVAGVVSTLALHHFTDLGRAFSEMARVVGSGPLVLFTFDMEAVESASPWMRDYWPSLYEDDRSRFPPLSEVAKTAESSTGRASEIIPFALPPDLTDLFFASGWCRPELYLDPEVRAGISCFALGNPDAVEAGLERLRADLASGEWERRFGTAREQNEFDGGYRFLVLRNAIAGELSPASWTR